jgi:polysaccharide deacetylase family protein (PEP-CTERM system associated)
MSQTLVFGPPAISVDVEDWPQSTWDRSLPITERAAVNTRKLLSLLREIDVHATMFVLGKFAEKFPDVVREIQAQGHEVASHGYGHIEIFRQSRSEFADDVLRSKELLEHIIGEPVRGYRAPDFSITLNTSWALDALAKAGFEYDSSIFPIQHARYGFPNWPVFPVRVSVGGQKSITEFPIATFRCLRRNWPVGGGGYHRLLPGAMARYLAKSVMESIPFVFYCHPYELDALELEQLSVQIPWAIRLHQGLGRRSFTARLEAFLRRFGGRRIKDLLCSSEWPQFSIEAFEQLSQPEKGVNGFFSLPDSPREHNAINSRRRRWL